MTHCSCQKCIVKLLSHIIVHRAVLKRQYEMVSAQQLNFPLLPIGGMSIAELCIGGHVSQTVAVIVHIHEMHQLSNVFMTTIGRIAVGRNPSDKMRFARQIRRRRDETIPGALSKEIERQIVESDMSTVSNRDVSIESSHQGGRPEVTTVEGKRGFGTVSDPQWTPITNRCWPRWQMRRLQINQCEENRVGSDATI